MCIERNRVKDKKINPIYSWVYCYFCICILLYIIYSYTRQNTLKRLKNIYIMNSASMSYELLFG